MKKVILSSILGALLLGGVSSAAVQTKLKEEPINSPTVAAQAISKGKKEIRKESAKKIVKEAAEAVKLTRQAIRAINDKDKDKAIKLLEKGIGKLSVAITDPKTPPLIPIKMNVIVQEFPGTSKDVERARAVALALLRTGAIQDARPLVASMADEIDLVTINLPLASYPDAMKLASTYLHEGKLKEAKMVLVDALSTFVEARIVTPIGLIQAQKLIGEASKIAKKNKRLALSHLAAARAALDKAEALGYFSKSSTTYKALNEQIREIEKEIKGKNQAEKLFQELLDKLKEFKDKAVRSVKS